MSLTLRARLCAASAAVLLLAGCGGGDGDGRAADAAPPEDVDSAMRLGVNYPRGPLAWGEELGFEWVREVLRNLHQAYPGGRYAPSRPLNRRAAVEGRLL